ncbi:hypothetical protein OKW30_008307 [Paraburkholderia sp. Clong3]|uniref:hypothetical protein n=1 Tax=Paraburkholderia sp. Clong3 TaxID=2991061 RepID=UPI003D1EEDB9
MDRTYFPSHRRSDAGGCLRWDRSAQDLSAMARALDFGPYDPNPRSLSKDILGDDAVGVRRLTVLPQDAVVAAGGLLEIHPDHWRVATSTQDVDVWFGSPDDQVLDARVLAMDGGLAAGDRRSILSDAQARSLTAIYEELAPREDFWRARLKKHKHCSFLACRRP